MKEDAIISERLPVINLLLFRRMLNHGKGGAQESDDWKNLFRCSVLRGHKWALKQE